MHCIYRVSLNSYPYALKILKSYNLFYKTPPARQPLLAKIQVVMQVNSHYFYPFTSFVLSVFKNKTCILHHLAFPFGRQLAIFSRPITHFQTPKTYFFTAILSFLAIFLMVLRGYVYTIMPYFYAFCLAFSTKSHCILHHFTLRLAPKRVVFSGKTQCILHQNAVRLAAYCSKFSGKHPRNWCKWRCFDINIHFAAFTI